MIDENAVGREKEGNGQKLDKCENGGIFAFLSFFFCETADEKGKIKTTLEGKKEKKKKNKIRRRCEWREENEHWMGHGCNKQRGRSCDVKAETFGLENMEGKTL